MRTYVAVAADLGIAEPLRTWVRTDDDADTPAGTDSGGPTPAEELARLCEEKQAAEQARQGAQLDELVPVLAWAGQTGHLGAQDQANVVQSDLR